MTCGCLSEGKAKMLSVARARAIALFILAVTFVIAFTAASSTSTEAQQSASSGLERAHAHNDYEHERPLFDALDHNFKSVEADIWLVNGNSSSPTIRKMCRKPCRRAGPSRRSISSRCAG
jgi:hypothetical protein